VVLGRRGSSQKVGVAAALFPSSFSSRFVLRFVLIHSLSVTTDPKDPYMTKTRLSLLYRHIEKEKENTKRKPTRSPVLAVPFFGGRN